MIGAASPILVTGAAGFIGSRVVGALLRLGFENIRCGVRKSSDSSLLEAVIPEGMASRCQVLEANLLSSDDCRRATDNVELVYHLVAGRGKSFPACFQGSVITTRNLLDALLANGRVKRFVNVGSFAVYSNFTLARGGVGRVLPFGNPPRGRPDAYVYGKLKQDELVLEYHRRFALPYTIVRPGIVFGPGKKRSPHLSA